MCHPDAFLRTEAFLPPAARRVDSWRLTAGPVWAVPSAEGNHLAQVYVPLWVAALILCSIRGTQSWLHASIRYNVEGTSQLQVSCRTGWGPSCNHSQVSLCPPRPSLPYPETICLCSTSPAHSLFPGRPYLSKTRCLYVRLFLNKNKVNTYVSTN